MEKIEENVYLEGYNSLPLRRKNCKKYRRASDVTSVNKGVLPGRRFSSVHGVEDHGIGQADSGSFVALTLMNKAPEKVTKPIPVDSRKSRELQAFKLSEIKKYYDNATEELQRTKSQLQNNPSDDKLASKVKEQEALVKKLEDQLKAQAAEETSPDIGNGDGSVAPWLPEGPKHKKSGSTPIDFTPNPRELRAISRSKSDASSRVTFRKPSTSQKRQPGDISPEVYLSFTSAV